MTFNVPKYLPVKKKKKSGKNREFNMPYQRYAQSSCSFIADRYRIVYGLLCPFLTSKIKKMYRNNSMEHTLHTIIFKNILKIHIEKIKLKINV